MGLFSRVKFRRHLIAIRQRNLFSRDQPFYRYLTVRSDVAAFREGLADYRARHPGQLTLVDVDRRGGYNCRHVLRDMTGIDYWGIDGEPVRDVTNLLVMDICQPRIGGRVPQSAPLIDWMGGWLERWFVYYIGLMPVTQESIPARQA